MFPQLKLKGVQYFLFIIAAIACSKVAFGDEIILDMREGSSGSEGFENSETARALIKKGAYGLKAFVDAGGPKYYVLFSEKLGFTKMNGDESEWKVWPLERWGNVFLEEMVRKRYSEYGQTISSPSVAGSIGEPIDEGYLGCLPATPLRYGDFTNDGEPELIIITGGDFLVLSPREEKTIFSSRLLVHDTISKERTTEIIEDGGRPYGDRPQYSSRILENAAQGHHDHLRAGYRGYAKLFWGDVNDNGQRDIIEWRKLYESLERDAGKEGFELKKETLLHHEFQNGEFHRRETETEQIQQWLKDKEWVWAEGWPNYSECEGEKGQLIPELHDPLFNDPEVLKGVDPETMTLVEDKED